MKTTTPVRRYCTRLAPLAAVFLIAALADPTTTFAKVLKVRGSLKAVEVQTVTPPTMVSMGTIKGTIRLPDSRDCKRRN